MNKTRKTLTIRLPEWMLDQLKELCEQTGRSLSREIEMCLKNHLDYIGSRNPQTLSEEEKKRMEETIRIANIQWVH